VPLAEGRTLRNEVIELLISESTGGIQSLRTHRDRKTRVSQRLVMHDPRLPQETAASADAAAAPQPSTRMLADRIEITLLPSSADVRTVVLEHPGPTPPERLLWRDAPPPATPDPASPPTAFELRLILEHRAIYVANPPAAAAGAARPGLELVGPDRRSAIRRHADEVAAAHAAGVDQDALDREQWPPPRRRADRTRARSAARPSEARP
jgi:hypothetical protein